MGRRGHLSIKPHNVKIRPNLSEQPDAEPAHVKVPLQQEQDEDEGDADASFTAHEELQGEKRPLSGKVISITGILIGRPELIKQIEALGAHHELALTLDTTHLIAETVTTEKYKVAVEYGKRIMDPRWIRIMHQTWLSGEHVDVEALEAKYKLGPLHNLAIAMTGFSLDPPELRKGIINSIINAGATYRATFDSKCTHLLVGPLVQDAEIYSNAKILKANEYNSYPDERVFVVWSEWLDDCLALQGALNESKYDVTCPRLQLDRIRVPKIYGTSQATTSQQLLRQASTFVFGPDASAGGAEPPGTNMNMDMDDVSTSAPARKRPAGHGQLEQEKVKRRKISRGDSVANLLGFGHQPQDVRLDDTPESEWEEAPVPQSLGLNLTKSLSSISSGLGAPKLALGLGQARSASFAGPGSASFAGPGSTWAQRPFVNSFTTGSTASTANAKLESRSGRPKSRQLSNIVQEADAEADTDTNNVQNVNDLAIRLPSPNNQKLSAVPLLSPTLVDGQDAFFSGMTIALVGFDKVKTRAATLAIQRHGGRVLHVMDQAEFELAYDSNYVVCPIHNPPRYVNVNDSRVVSPAWLERCMFLEEHITDLDSHFAFRPFRGGPLPDADKYHVVASGFDECDVMAIRRICQAQGIHFSDEFVKNRTTHCIAKGSGASKIRKAQKAGVPIVDVAWLMQLVQSVPEPDPENLALSACVVVLSRKVDGSINRKRLIDSVTQLGGRVATNISAETTHYVYASARANENFKDFKLAKEVKAAIVHPSWIDECLKQQQRLNEVLFPHTIAEGKTLTYTLSQQVVSRGIERSASTSPPPVRSSQPPKPLANGPAPAQNQTPFDEDPLPVPAPFSQEDLAPTMDVPPTPPQEAPGGGGGLTESLLVNIKSLFEKKHIPSDPASSSDEKPSFYGSRRRRVGGPVKSTADRSLEPAPFAVPPLTGGVKPRLPYDMTQFQPTQWDESVEAEEHLRITVIDPVAEQAKARLLNMNRH